MMNKQQRIGRQWIIGFGFLLGLLIVGLMAWNGLPAFAQTAVDAPAEVERIDDEDKQEGADVPIQGPALEQASQAALEYIGDGRVTDTEVGDEEGFYEIEITRSNGRQVDVHLDEALTILGHEDE